MQHNDFKSNKITSHLSALCDYSQPLAEKHKVVQLHPGSLIHPVCSAVFFPGGDIAILHYKDSHINCLDPQTGTYKSQLYGFGEHLEIAMLPNEDLVSLTATSLEEGGYEISIWGHKKPKRSWGCGNNEMKCFITLPSSEIVTASFKNILVWDSKTGQLVRTLTGHEDNVRALASLSSGEIVSLSIDNSIRIWDKENNSCKKIINLPGGASYIRVTPTDEIITFTFFNLLRIWNKDTGECVNIIETKPLLEALFVILPTGDIAISDGNKTILILDVKTGECKQQLQGHEAEINFITVAPVSGDILSFDENDIVHIWKFSPQNLAHSLSDQKTIQLVFESMLGQVVIHISIKDTLGNLKEKIAECLRAKKHGDFTYNIGFRLICNGQKVSDNLTQKYSNDTLIEDLFDIRDPRMGSIIPIRDSVTHDDPFVFIRKSIVTPSNLMLSRYQQLPADHKKYLSVITEKERHIIDGLHLSTEDYFNQLSRERQDELLAGFSSKKTSTLGCVLQ